MEREVSDPTIPITSPRDATTSNLHATLMGGTPVAGPEGIESHASGPVLRVKQKELLMFEFTPVRRLPRCGCALLSCTGV